MLRGPELIPGELCKNLECISCGFRHFTGQEGFYGLMQESARVRVQADISVRWRNGFLSVAVLVCIQVCFIEISFSGLGPAARISEVACEICISFLNKFASSLVSVNFRLERSICSPFHPLPPASFSSFRTPTPSSLTSRPLFFLLRASWKAL